MEQAWAENKFTAEGRLMHENAHEGADKTRAGVRITRGIPVVSKVLGLTGQCDVVEFAACGSNLKFEISDLRERDGDAGREAPFNLKSQISNLNV